MYRSTDYAKVEPNNPSVANTFSGSQPFSEPDRHHFEEIPDSGIQDVDYECVGLLTDHDIRKHEINVNILPFDIICDARPILSCMGVIVDVLPTSAGVAKATERHKPKSNIQSAKVVTLPIVTVQLLF